MSSEDEEAPLPSKPIQIGVSETPKFTLPPPSETLELKQMASSSIVGKTSGINLMNNVMGVDNIREKLSGMGITVQKILYFRYGNGTLAAAFLYCVTLHGHYVLIEPPPGMSIPGGDLTLIETRTGFLPSSTTDRFTDALRGIYTGYAFICGGGIHYVRAIGQDPIIYSYGDHEIARVLFDIKKHHYILIPALQFASLVEPSRLNTLEAYISMVDKGGILKQLMVKAGLVKLLTVKGPITVFMPEDSRLTTLQNLDSNKLRATILAHIVIGRIDSQKDSNSQSGNPFNGKAKGGLADKNSVSSLGTEDIQLKAIGQNDILVKKVNGVIVRVSSGGKDARIVAKKIETDKPIVRRFNGIMYRIDAIFTPTSEQFIMPEKSDMDDVLTIFDITKSTMEIRRAQYGINLEKHHTLLVTLDHLQTLASTLASEIQRKSEEDGKLLLQDSSRLMTLFCSQDIPCDETCSEMDQLAARVRDENASFERLLRASNRLASLKVTVETTLLKMSRIDQKLHVETIIDRPLNPDDSDTE